MATWYGDTWYYFDEWSTIERSLDSWSGMFAGHQGHLSVFSFVLYRIQRTIFGLDGQEVLWAALMASVAAMQVTLALLLRRLGLSTLFALLIASAVTFFGPGAQDVVWAFQWNINLALALSFFAAVLALRDSPTPRLAVAVATLLVLAVAADSGVAIIGAIFVGILIVQRWPSRLALTALATPFIAHVAWLILGDNPHYSASFDKVWTLANRLVLYSAAGLVGGGETHTTHGGPPDPPVIGISAGKLGLAVLAVAAALVAYGLHRQRVSRPVIAALVAGTVTAVAAAGLLAWSRAFLTPPSQLFGNRYIQWVAFFLVIALVPAIAASVRTAAVPRPWVNVVAALAVVAVFVVNLEQFRPVLDFYKAKGQETKVVVGEAVSLLQAGCRNGRQPHPDTEPNPELAPQISVALIDDLLEDGSLAGVPVVRATSTTRRAVC